MVEPELLAYEWSIRSLDLNGEYTFWETPYKSEVEARTAFDGHKRHADESGGRYQLFYKGQKKADYFSMAENE
jgi:hypothetical protein